MVTPFSFSGNPLVCNCKLMWLKSWLHESTSIGPKCADGSHVKSMPFTRLDCQGIPMNNDELKSCIVNENEALLPNLATSQVFSSLDKIKDYSNKANNRPTPEESEYFYDEYVDYPYNESLGLNNDVNFAEKHQKNPTLHMGIKNYTNKDPSSTPVPSSGFTFFGMPLPSLDMGKLWNTGRKIDWADNQNSRKSNNFVSEQPKFETGGFAPILPTTAGGFTPIPNPNVNKTQKINSNHSSTNIISNLNMDQNISFTDTSQPNKVVNTTATHKKVMTEIHELEAFIDNDNKTQMTYNRTKNVEEQKTDPNQVSKYNFVESNVTITQVTEKEGILITTDTSNDMSLQTWLDTSTVNYVSSTPFTTKSPMRKHTDSPTALSAILVPSDEEILRKNVKNRPATITKVNMPHLEPYELQDSYSPINNREAKTRFSESTNAASTKTRETNGKDWYYKNYNNSNLEPYVAPGVQAESKGFTVKYNVMAFLVLVILNLL